MRYALIRPDDTIDRMSENVDPNVQTKQGWRWLPAPRIERPAYSPDTQVCEGPNFSVGADQVSEAYSVRNKTAQELDDDKTAKLPAADTVQFRVLFNHENRIRVLEGKQPITAEQFRAALKALL